MRSKKPVWFLFKLVELLLSLACCIVHWRCFRDDHVPHIFLLCAAYGGSIIICTLALIGAFYAEKPTMKHEATHAGILGSLHLFTVYVHMYMATMERFRTKEWAGFYKCCRDNAMVSLYATAIYLLHMTFALDLMFSHSRVKGKHPHRSKRPLRLYFISPGVEAYVSGFWWFQLIASKMLTSTQASEHSDRTRHLSFDAESDSEPRVSGVHKSAVDLKEQADE